MDTKQRSQTAFFSNARVRQRFDTRRGKTTEHWLCPGGLHCTEATRLTPMLQTDKPRNWGGILASTAGLKTPNSCRVPALLSLTTLTAPPYHIPCLPYPTPPCMYSTLSYPTLPDPALPYHTLTYPTLYALPCLPLYLYNLYVYPYDPSPPYILPCLVACPTRPYPVLPYPTHRPDPALPYLSRYIVYTIPWLPCEIPGLPYINTRPCPAC